MAIRIPLFCEHQTAQQSRSNVRFSSPLITLSSRSIGCFLAMRAKVRLVIQGFRGRHAGMEKNSADLIRSHLAKSSAWVSSATHFGISGALANSSRNCSMTHPPSTTARASHTGLSQKISPCTRRTHPHLRMDHLVVREVSRAQDNFAMRASNHQRRRPLPGNRHVINPGLCSRRRRSRGTTLQEKGVGGNLVKFLQHLV